jgi:hypothetical protein
MLISTLPRMPAFLSQYLESKKPRENNNFDKAWKA